MSTDENHTMSETDAGNPEPGNEPLANAEAAQAAEVSGNETAEATPVEAATQAEAAPQAEGADADDPDDDIGNRVDAGAAAVPQAGDAPAKKRRRRRRKKHGQGATPGAAAAEGSAEGAEGGSAGDDESEGEETSAEGEHAEGEHAEGGAAPEGDKARQGKKRKGPPLPPREKPAFGVGEEIFGKVERITDDAIWIDIAGKALGLFDRRELGTDDLPQDGDQFLATVASVGIRGGMLVLSRTAADLDKAREAAEAASKSNEPIEGFVTGVVKGGLEVDLHGLRAFAPASHMDLRHGVDLTYLVGQRLDFFVTQYAKKGRDVVVSRKRMLEEEARQVRAGILSTLEPGTVHQGIVRTVMPWGVFVALPEAAGIEGLVHLTEASHDRGAKLQEIFRVGEPIEVKVVRIDEKGKLWLSRKAAQSDPWEEVKQKYAVGTKHRGKVVRLQAFGAFIELESGIDGLCHTADLSIKPIEGPQEVVKVGDEIDVVVASSDPSGHRIGLHPALPAGSEDEPKQRVQLYKPIKAAVVQTSEAGLLVRILGVTGRAARGFVPAGQTGTPRGADLRKEFPVGQVLDAKVIDMDVRKSDVKLSVRALKDDAEKQAYQQYRAGVARDAKFGTFADLMKKG